MTGQPVADELVRLERRCTAERRLSTGTVVPCGGTRLPGQALCWLCWTGRQRDEPERVYAHVSSRSLNVPSMVDLRSLGLTDGDLRASGPVGDGPDVMRVGVDGSVDMVWLASTASEPERAEASGCAVEYYGPSFSYALDDDEPDLDESLRQFAAQNERRRNGE